MRGTLGSSPPAPVMYYVINSCDFHFRLQKNVQHRSSFSIFVYSTFNLFFLPVVNGGKYVPVTPGTGIKKMTVSIIFSCKPTVAAVNAWSEYRDSNVRLGQLLYHPLKINPPIFFIIWHSICLR